MERVPSVHILEVKYNGTSATITSWRFDKKKRMGYRYCELERYEQVQQFIEKAGYTVTGRDGWKMNTDFITVKEYEWKW